MSGRAPRGWHGAGWRAGVTAAAFALAVAAAGFFTWSVTTTSTVRLAWLTSIATVAAVVLSAWAMSAGMVTWVVRSGRTRTGDSPGRVRRPARFLAAGTWEDASAVAAGGLPVGVPCRQAA